LGAGKEVETCEFGGASVTTQNILDQDGVLGALHVVAVEGNVHVDVVVRRQQVRANLNGTTQTQRIKVGHGRESRRARNHGRCGKTI